MRGGGEGKGGKARTLKGEGEAAAREALEVLEVVVWVEVGLHLDVLAAVVAAARLCATPRETRSAREYGSQGNTRDAPSLESTS